jgi:hypothetical protein
MMKNSNIRIQWIFTAIGVYKTVFCTFSVEFCAFSIESPPLSVFTILAFALSVLNFALSVLNLPPIKHWKCKIYRYIGRL